MPSLAKRPETYRPLLLSGGVHASAARWPRRTALTCEGVSRTYAELSSRIRSVAGALVGLGLRRGDRIALVAPNCLEYPEILCGAADAGLVTATLNPRSTTAEIAAACDDCGARLLIAHPGIANVAFAAKSLTLQRRIALGAEYEAWLQGATMVSTDPAIEETDPFTLVYSSGTTGRPKGILISHRSRVLTFHGMAMEYGCYGSDDLQLGIAPLAHGAGFAFTMATLYFGGTVEVMTRFDPELTLHKLASLPVTGVFMVPTHFHSIFALEASARERYRGRFAALRTIISNASALPQALKEQIVGYWGDGLLHETYGSTEAGIVTNLRPRDQLARRQSVGHPFGPTLVRLLDDSGREVPNGEVGELFSTSPYLFNGYFGRPDETAAALRDGWVTAGDLARRDDDGYLYIVDRKKDMVITGGYNVYPREIEEVLQRHPAVLEAAVIGVPDEQWGEALVAYLVAREGFNVSARDLDMHCRATLAGFKVPKDFRPIATLPRNAGGKILKNELRRVPG
jgi:long-chain acyl-CoA synthetase